MESGIKHQVLIVGGGFGGVKTALELAEYKNVAVTLLSDKSHFEYHAALYRVVTGRSPMEVCIPLSEIFAGKQVEIIKDTIVGIDRTNQQANGQSGRSYRYDWLVLALGSETTYLQIPGLEKLSYGFKSISEALELRNHLHLIMANGATEAKDAKARSCHIIVVGGGASGVEIAGELTVYVRRLAHQHGLDRSHVVVDLIEAAPRLLPGLPDSVSREATKRLHQLGVNIYLNRAIVKEEIESVYLKDMEIKTKTLVWTAGIQPNRLYRAMTGLEYDKKGRVVVDQYLRPKDSDNIFIVGDAASTQFSGMAQTAIRDGALVAENIVNLHLRRPLRSYVAKKPVYAIPIGPGWGISTFLGLQISGRIGWWLRRWADLKFFLTILPMRKAWLVFANGRTISETCSICSPADEALN